MSTSNVKVPDLALPRLKAMLSAKAQLDREIASYLSGILVANGIDDTRLGGYDETTNEIVVTDEGTGAS